MADYAIGLRPKKSMGDESIEVSFFMQIYPMPLKLADPTSLCSERPLKTSGIYIPIFQRMDIT